jgi:hypothetical protein
MKPLGRRITLTLALLLRPAAALACPICFGVGDGPAADGMNAGITVLLGVTAVVLAGIGVAIVALARRARRYAPPAPVPRLALVARPQHGERA